MKKYSESLIQLTQSPTEFWVDKERIKRSFSRKAAFYDQTAKFQQKTGRDLLDNLKRHNIKARRILDIGMGTAWLTGPLSCVYPEALIVGFDLAAGMVNFAASRYLIHKEQFAKFENASKTDAFLPRCRFLQADAERLPFRRESFDLAVSNLVYQWVNDLDTALGQLGSVLVPGGRLMFTTLGPETLSELHRAYLKAHQRLKIPPYPHGQRFFSSPQVVFLLRKAGLSKINIQVKKTRQLFSNSIELARALKNIGAANALSNRPAGLGGRLLFQQMSEYYQDYYSCSDGIYATFEIFTVQAVKDGHVL